MDTDTERRWNGNGASHRRLPEPSQARDGDSETKQLGREVRDEVSLYASEARQQMRSMAEAGREEVAGQLDGIARAFDGSGEQLRAQQQETAGRYARSIGERIERASRYVQERDTAALTGDTERFARSQPLLFLGGCALAGFALGRFLRASPPAPEGEAVSTAPTVAVSSGGGAEARRVGPGRERGDDEPNGGR